MPDEKPFSVIDGKALVDVVTLGDPAEPAPPLVGGGIMHPSGVTILYGAANVGKGWVALWTVRELQREGFKPVIIDFEHHQWEWRGRAYGMGIHGVSLLTPRIPLNETNAPGIAAYFGDATHIVLDSVSAARGRVADNDAGGQDAAMGFFRAVRRFERPTLALAHTSKAGGSGPIGSMQYMAQSRILWRAEKPNEQTTILTMEIDHDRPVRTTPLTFTRVIDPGGRVSVELDYHKVLVQEDRESLTNAILRILKERNRRLNVSDLHYALHLEGRDTSIASVRVTTHRMAERGSLTREQEGNAVFFSYPLEKNTT